jgi:hypothetical protein
MVEGARPGLIKRLRAAVGLEVAHRAGVSRPMEELSVRISTSRCTFPGPILKSASGSHKIEKRGGQA